MTARSSSRLRLPRTIAALGAAYAIGLVASAYEARAQQPAPPAPQQEAPEIAPSLPDGERDEGPRSPSNDLPNTAEEKSKILADLYAHLATADTPEAAKKIQATIERLWGFSGSDTVALLMQRASKSLGAKDYDQALKFLDYVVQLAPDYAEGFNRRAFVHFSRNDMASAVGDLRRALALEPNHFRALDGLAQIWRQTGNTKGALSVVKQLLEIYPYWEGAARMAEELAREVEGQGI